MAMMMSAGMGRAKGAIRKAKTIAISGHVNPDGDSIGSLLGLGLGLEKLGKRVTMLSCDGVPRRYEGLPGACRIVKKPRSPVDLAISVDCSSKEILGPAYEGAFVGAGKILEIDHHDFRRPFGDIAVVDRKAAAVGEIVYALLKGLGAPITKDVAQNIMTSIVIETNSFRLPNVRTFTFEVCTRLIERGVDFYRLVDTVFWSRRKAAAVLSGVCLARSRFTCGGQVVWSMVRKSDFDAAKGKDEDVDAVPDDMRSIAGVRIAVLFREKEPGVLRVSLRSKDRLNVAEIAEYYGGGGHFDVAGCSISDTPATVREFLRRVEGLLR